MLGVVADLDCLHQTDVVSSFPFFLVGLLAREAWGLFEADGLVVPPRLVDGTWRPGHTAEELSADFPGMTREIARLQAVPDDDLSKAILWQLSGEAPTDFIFMPGSLEDELVARDPVVLSTAFGVQQDYVPRVRWMYNAGQRFPAELLPLLSQKADILIGPTDFDPGLADCLNRLGAILLRLVADSPDTFAVHYMMDWADDLAKTEGRDVVDVMLWSLDMVQRHGCEHAIEHVIGLREEDCTCVNR